MYITYRTLCDNQLTEIPKEIGNLTALELLLVFIFCNI